MRHRKQITDASTVIDAPFVFFQFDSKLSLSQTVNYSNIQIHDLIMDCASSLTSLPLELQMQIFRSAKSTPSTGNNPHMVKVAVQQYQANLAVFCRICKSTLTAARMTLFLSPSMYYHSTKVQSVSQALKLLDNQEMGLSSIVRHMSLIMDYRPALYHRTPLFKSVLSCPRLRTLHISWQSGSELSIEEVLQGWRAGGLQVQELESLHLDGLDCPAAQIEDLLKHLLSFPALKRLHLGIRPTNTSAPSKKLVELMSKRLSDSSAALASFSLALQGKTRIAPEVVDAIADTVPTCICSITWIESSTVTSGFPMERLQRFSKLRHIAVKDVDGVEHLPYAWIACCWVVFSDLFLRSSVTSLHIDRRVGFLELPTAIDPRHFQHITHLSFEHLMVLEMHTAILQNHLPELQSLQYGAAFVYAAEQEIQNLKDLCSSKGIHVEALDSQADSVLCQCQQLQL